MFKKSILGLVALAFLSGTAVLATPDLGAKAELQRKIELVQAFQEANKDLSEAEYKQRKQEFMERDGITAVEFLLGLYEIHQLPDGFFNEGDTEYIFAQKNEPLIKFDEVDRKSV